MDNKELSSTLLDAVITEDGADLLASLGEVAFDTLVNQGLLKDIPVLGSLVQLVRVGMGVREYTFIRKLHRFALTLKGVSDIERDRFTRQLEQDKKFRSRVGENLILIIERLDDMDKPELVGKVFAAFMKGQISYDTFIRLSTAINRAYLPDLTEFSRYRPMFEVTTDWAQNLAACGLMNTKIEVVWGPAESKVFYEANQLGKQLITICFSS